MMRLSVLHAETHSSSALRCLFFHDTATTEIYTLSLHDALPISPQIASRRTARPVGAFGRSNWIANGVARPAERMPKAPTRSESTRLNSSHSQISYAVFCLKKKKKKQIEYHDATNDPATETRTQR